EYLDKGGASEIMNIGTGTGNSVMEIVKQVEEITGKHIEVSPGVARAESMQRWLQQLKKLLLSSGGNQHIHLQIVSNHW
ncbi:hypothetical protein KBD81_00775, partial [Candidatus Woesebacteria bacterium]|nr:hypothetical protein [Candidatus Woesebacteria bacterium]